MSAKKNVIISSVSLIFSVIILSNMVYYYNYCPDIDLHPDPTVPLINAIAIDLPKENKKTSKNIIKYTLKEIEEMIKNVALISKNDLMYLNEYSPTDRIHIIKYSAKYNIPIVYLYRQDYIESKLGKDLFHNYKKYADIGFKQLNTKYLSWFVEKYYEIDEPFDPYNNEHSIQIGCAYLKDLYEQFFNDWRIAFEAYNAGPTRVRAFKVPEVSKEYALCILNGYSPDFIYIEAAARGML